MARNWVRSVATSACVKPAFSRRSKPRGAGVVVDVFCGAEEVPAPVPVG